MRHTLKLSLLILCLLGHYIHVYISNINLRCLNLLVNRLSTKDKGLVLRTKLSTACPGQCELNTMTNYTADSALNEYNIKSALFILKEINQTRLKSVLLSQEIKSLCHDQPYFVRPLAALKYAWLYMPMVYHELFRPNTILSHNVTHTSGLLVNWYVVNLRRIEPLYLQVSWLDRAKYCMQVIALSTGCIVNILLFIITYLTLLPALIVRYTIYPLTQLI